VVDFGRLGWDMGVRHGSDRRVKLRFSSFEVDLDSGELRKNGLRIKLPDQAFKVLAALLEQAGEVVTREQLQQKLWPADTLVDFDHGLNKAINRVREALCDSASTPRFLETLPRRGYRFIAEIRPVPAPAEPPATPVISAVPRPVGPAPFDRKRIVWAATIAFLALVAAIPATRLLHHTDAWKRAHPISTGQPSQSIAVLPFLNFSPDTADEYLADGITEEIIHSLAGVEGLNVISQTSSFAFKSKQPELREVGAKLRVGHVVEGSVRKSGETLRITAQLIRVADDTHRSHNPGGNRAECRHNAAREARRARKTFNEALYGEPGRL